MAGSKSKLIRAILPGEKSYLLKSSSDWSAFSRKSFGEVPNLKSVPGSTSCFWKATLPSAAIPNRTNLVLSADTPSEDEGIAVRR